MSIARGAKGAGIFLQKLVSLSARWRDVAHLGRFGFRFGGFRRPTGKVFNRVIFFRRVVALWTLIGAGLGLDSTVSPLWAWHPGQSTSEAVLIWADWSRSVYSREHVPYFALHPPVYYTQPIGRPYGWSPFAYPAWVQTPLVEPPRPMVIQNPYVVGFGPRGKPPFIGAVGTGIGEPPPSAAQTPQPIRIVNPYLTSDGAEGAGSASTKAPGGEKQPISSTAAIQPRRIRNPYLEENR
ncbi:MAG: hypothetical protein NZ602_16640 [Thermoguttaceae bacterium]|nr:hypothetical protein [Thermoguttaceae bacterium]MDW8038525.1 hypothetical protein [Thermoguttaceae bacterium]